MHIYMPKRSRPLLARLLETLPPRFSTPSTQDLVRSCQALLSAEGEVSGRRLATTILSGYNRLNTQARHEFLDAVALRFAPPADQVNQAAKAYAQAPSEAALSRLQSAVEPPRQELFRRLNLAPGGTA